jgi:hypothetical protein
MQRNSSYDDTTAYYKTAMIWRIWHWCNSAESNRNKHSYIRI